MVNSKLYEHWNILMLKTITLEKCFTDCDEILGLTTGTVLDNMMSASSTYHPLSTSAGRARVNQKESKCCKHLHLFLNTILGLFWWFSACKFLRRKSKSLLSSDACINLGVLVSWLSDPFDSEFLKEKNLRFCDHCFICIIKIKKTTVILFLCLDSYSNLAGAWVAGTIDTNQYVEIDMKMPYKFTAVQIQGRSDADEWVTSFQVLYQENGTWHTYVNSSGQQVSHVKVKSP